MLEVDDHSDDETEHEGIKIIGSVPQLEAISAYLKALEAFAEKEKKKQEEIDHDIQEFRRRDTLIQSKLEESMRSKHVIPINVMLMN